MMRFMFALILLSILIALDCVPGWGLLDAVLYVLALPLFALLALGALLPAAHALRRRRSWLAAAHVASGLAIGVIGCSSALLSRTISPYVQLCLVHGELDAQVSRIPHGPAPRVAVIMTDTAFMMASGLAYDDSDQLGLPPAERSKEWVAHAQGADCWRASRLVGHYYKWWDDGVPCAQATKAMTPA
jgi:hypothetical protein